MVESGQFYSSLITFHFKMAGSAGALENIIHHSSFIISKQEALRTLWKMVPFANGY